MKKNVKGERRSQIQKSMYVEKQQFRVVAS